MIVQMKPDDLARLSRHEIARRAAEYKDRKRAKQYLMSLREGSKESPWYADDPINDKDSLYLKRVLATLNICLDILQNSHDDRLINEAKVFILDFKGQL